MSPVPLVRLPVRFRDVTERRSTGAQIVDAWDGSRRVRLVVVPGRGATRTELERALETANRYALGIRALVLAREVVELDGACALVYDGASAETLAEALRTDAMRARAVDVLRQIAKALAALHGQGIAHGHLCAELIEIADAGVRIQGYGVADVALAIGGAELAREILPEPTRAPELRSAGAARPDSYADVYAFGVMATRLLGLSDSTPRDDAGWRGAGERVARLIDPSPSARPLDLVAWVDELAALESPQADATAGPAARVVPELVAEPTAQPAEQQPAEQQPAEQQPAEQQPAVSLVQGAQSSAELRAPESPDREVPRDTGERGAEIRELTKGERRVWLIAVPLVCGALALFAAIGVLFVLGLTKARSRTPVVASATVAAVGASAPVSDGGMPANDAGEPTNDAGTPASDARADETDGGAEVPFPSASATPAHDKRVPDGGGTSSADARAAIPVAAHAPIWGPAGALVTIVVFGDLECPHTRRAYATLDRLKQMYGSELRLVWYDRPIPVHEHAESAARWIQALEATSGSAVTWRLLDYVLSGTAVPDPATLARWTRGNGADVERVQRRSALDSDALAFEQTLAGRYDVRGTPTLYVNGFRIDGVVSPARLLAIVRSEFAAGVALVASGVPRSDVYSRRVAQNLIALGPAIAPRACIDPSGAPARGAAVPLATLVEFCDFGSDACHRLEPTIRSLAARYPRDLRFIYKGLLVGSRAEDRLAWGLALEARSQGGDSAFWKVHDLLLDSTPPFDAGRLSEIATRAGLDAARALDESAGSRHADSMSDDERLANRLGIHRIPGCFVNGRPIPCSVPGTLDNAVGAEIALARTLIASGFDRSRIAQAWCGLP